MAVLLVLPFVVQGALMAVDEFYYHHRRRLPRWERIGHPLDTLTVLACYAWILVVPPATTGAVATYAALAIFSTAFVTKDEFVHARECAPAEHFLHALLFGFHALVLLAAGLIWPALHPDAANVMQGAVGFVSPDMIPVVVVGLKIQMAGTVAFLLYQITYWNFPWKPTPDARQ